MTDLERAARALGAGRYRILHPRAQITHAATCRSYRGLSGCDCDFDRICIEFYAALAAPPPSREAVVEAIKGARYENPGGGWTIGNYLADWVVAAIVDAVMPYVKP